MRKLKPTERETRKCAFCITDIKHNLFAYYEIQVLMQVQILKVTFYIRALLQIYTHYIFSQH